MKKKKITKITSDELFGILNNEDQFTQIAIEAFQAVDTDNNGTMEANELEMILANVSAYVGVESPNEKQMKKLLKYINFTPDGHILQDEFQIVLRNILYFMAKLLKQQEQERAENLEFDDFYNYN